MAKTRSERDLYEPEFLNELREKVINKYLDDTHQKGVIRLEFSSDKHSKTYIGFNDQFLKVFKTTLNGETQVRFFNRELDDNRNEIPLSKPKRFERSTIALLIEYINTFIEKGETDKFFLKNRRIDGCDLIDWEFVLNHQRNNHGHSWEDFYLAKQRDFCQWVGIVKEWDYPRPITEKIIDEIKSAFEWESAVAAVIYGDGGCGKSTFLRRLAVRAVKENLVVLWVNRLSELIQSLGDIVASLKYLIIIEDWSAYEYESDLVQNFLNEVANRDNIKIVIGDRVTEGKRYRKHVLGNNYFELNTEQNDKILERVLHFNENWRPIVETLPSNEILKAPIFIVLFVIAREYEGEIPKSTKGLVSRFLEIIQDDLKVISDEYPGLVKALYYWACINREYEIRTAWEVILKLSGFFDNNNKIVLSLSKINLNNPTWKIIIRYMSFRDFINPAFEHTYKFSFIHDLFMEAFMQPINKNWYFDEEVEVQTIEALIEIGEITTARVLFIHLFDANFKYLNEFKLNENARLNRMLDKMALFDNFSSMSSYFNYEDLIEKFYYGSLSLEDGAALYLLLNLIARNFRENSLRAMQKVTGKLISMGCEVPLVKYAKDACETDESFQKLIKRLKSPKIPWNLITHPKPLDKSS